MLLLLEVDPVAMSLPLRLPSLAWRSVLQPSTHTFPHTRWHVHLKYLYSTSSSHTAPHIFFLMLVCLSLSIFPLSLLPPALPLLLRWLASSPVVVSVAPAWTLAASPPKHSCTLRTCMNMPRRISSLMASRYGMLSMLWSYSIAFICAVLCCDECYHEYYLMMPSRFSYYFPFLLTIDGQLSHERAWDVETEGYGSQGSDGRHWRTLQEVEGERRS